MSEQQPQRSEQQEFNDKIEVLCEQCDKVMPRWFRKKLNDIFNAALAAERQRREQAEREHDSKILSYITTHQADVNYNDKLKQQLLSALAAIEDAKKYVCNCPLHETVFASVDLSALREHDEEVGAKNWNEGYDEATTIHP